MTALIISLLIGGSVAGLLAGLLGVGGGAVMVPVLYEVFRLSGVDADLQYHLAIGTSLAVMIPTALRSLSAHHQRGAVDWSVLRRWLLPILVGVAIGALIAKSFDGKSLRFVFAIMTLLIGLLLVLRQGGFVLGESLPGKGVTEGYGLLTGVLSTLMGIGGGTFSNLFFTAFNKPMHQSVATSSGVGVLISIPGMIGLTLAGIGETNLPSGSFGYVNWLAAVIILPMSIIMAPIGAKLAHALPADKLKKVFGLFLIIVSARFFYSLLS